MPEHNVRYLTHADLEREARRVASEVDRRYTGIDRTRPRLKLWGVPRGGIPATYLVARFLPHDEVVAHVDEADVIIDDIVDSGRTRDTYLERYPRASFHALIENSPEWVVFPWEGTLDASADDIPLRLLEFIGEDVKRGGLKDTPRRFLAAWREYTSGYGIEPAEILTSFDDGAEQYDEMVIVRDIPVYSHCEHHLAPFFGKAHVAYIPAGRVIGLSKLARLVNVFARRLQVQERLTKQVAHALSEHLQTVGVGVVLECRHMCMEARGVRAPGTTTVTSCMLGAMKGDAKARAELLRLVR